MVNIAVHNVAMSTQEDRDKRNRKVIHKGENGGKSQTQKQSMGEEVAQLTGWDSLPSEMQKEIVLRVFSVYDLGPLKLMSKFLSNLISSRDFIYAHLARSAPPKPQLSYIFTEAKHKKRAHPERILHRLLAFEINEDGSTTTLHNRELYLHTLPGLTIYDHITLLSSCNGLLLLRASACPNHEDPDRACKEDVRLFVCNPVTQVSTKLPTLAYANYHCCWWVTFGYDDRSRTYKAVGYRETWNKDLKRPAGKCEITVCTLASSGCSPWRVLDYDFNPKHVQLKSVVANNGRLIMLVLGETYEASWLFYMDLNKELLREISLPPSATTYPFRPNAVYEINGCLYCVVNDRHYGNGYPYKQCVDIWALRNIYNDAMMDCCWVKEHMVSMDSEILAGIDDVVTDNFQSRMVSKIIKAEGFNFLNVGSTSDGKKFMFFSLLHRKFISYDLQSQQVTVIKSYEEGNGSKDSNSTSRYVAQWLDLRCTHVSSLISWL